jgi:hypothetical protein
VPSGVRAWVAAGSWASPWIVAREARRLSPSGAVLSSLLLSGEFPRFDSSPGVCEGEWLVLRGVFTCDGMVVLSVFEFRETERSVPTDVMTVVASCGRYGAWARDAIGPTRQATWRKASILDRGARFPSPCCAGTASFIVRVVDPYSRRPFAAITSVSAQRRGYRRDKRSVVGMGEPRLPVVDVFPQFAEPYLTTRHALLPKSSASIVLAHWIFHSSSRAPNEDSEAHPTSRQQGGRWTSAPHDDD